MPMRSASCAASRIAGQVVFCGHSWKRMLLFLMALDTKRPVDTSAIAKDTKEHVLVSWSAQGALTPLVITGAKGSWLHAGERRILDFSSGLINVNLGHGHPK